MSRVRGTVSVAQLCSASGLGRDKTLKSLERLVDFGLLEIVGGGAAPSKQIPGREIIPTPDASVGSTRPVGDQPMVQRREAALHSGAQATATARQSEKEPQQSTGEERPLDPTFQPVQPSREVTILGSEDEDDLFMPDSIAHISKLSGQPGASNGGSRGRDRSESKSGDRGDEDDAEPAREASQSRIDAGDGDLFGAFGGAEQLADEATAAAEHGGVPGDETVSDDSDLFGGSQPQPDDDSDLFGDSISDEGQDEPPGFEHISVGDETTARPENVAPDEDEHRNAEATSTKKKRSKAPDLSLFPADFDDYQLDGSIAGQGADVDDGLKREIAFVHESLDRVNYYELFAVEKDAGRKEIRSSYFVLSKRYHPDLFFRKDAGPFAEMAEEIFKRVTKAYQILSRKKKRAEYDQALHDHEMAQQASGEQPSDDPEKRRKMAVDMLTRRAEKAEVSGDFAQAAEALKKVFALKKDAHIARKCANLLLRANQRLDEAAMFARVATREDPTNADAFVLLGQIYEKNEAMIEALDAYEHALDASPEDASILVHVERLRTLI